MNWWIDHSRMNLPNVSGQKVLFFEPTNSRAQGSLDPAFAEASAYVKTSARQAGGQAAQSPIAAIA